MEFTIFGYAIIYPPTFNHENKGFNDNSSFIFLEYTV